MSPQGHIKERRWQIFPAQPALTEQISTRLGCHPVVAQLLLNRGLPSLSAFRQFLTPESNPNACFPDAEIHPVLAILESAVQNKSRILVYADYDVDGMTSTALMVPFLQFLGANPTFKLPNRFKDGYGLSLSQVAWMQEFDLVITLDCGITNITEISALVANNRTKVVVLDHHTIGDLPPAHGILNPKTLSSDHPLYGLCTAGLVYVVMQAYCARYAIEYPLYAALDLVALGTLADVAPLVGENRYYVSEGLRVLSKRQRPGLNALLQETGFDKDYVSARDVGFVIAPRLNAAGRLADPMLGATLLMSTEKSEVDNLARVLCQMNMDRQRIGQAVMDEALAYIKQEKMENDPVLVVHGRGWHAGVIGIVASRLVETYGCPVVMIADTGEFARGSARTCGQANIYALLDSGRDFFHKFGGHKEAAGFSMHPDHIPALRDTVIQTARHTVSAQALMPIVQIDAMLDPKDIVLDLVQEIQKLGPFGAANPTPVFYSDQWTPVDIRLVGHGKHLKATFATPAGDRVVDAIGFGLAHKLEVLQQHTPQLAFHLDANTWAGNTMPQLQLVDIR